MNISENARIVLEKRYLTKDENNKVIETRADVRRVASALADLLTTKG